MTFLASSEITGVSIYQAYTDVAARIYSFLDLSSFLLLSQSVITPNTRLPLPVSYPRLHIPSFLCLPDLCTTSAVWMTSPRITASKAYYASRTTRNCLKWGLSTVFHWGEVRSRPVPSARRELCWHEDLYRPPKDLCDLLGSRCQKPG